jgi:PIN domain-containing protein
VKLLVDHNLSPAIARALQPLFPDHTFLALKDRFPHDTSDIDWTTELNREGGWTVLTKDLRIQFRPHERLALDRSKIVFFFLAGAWRKYSVPETAARLIRLVPLMAKQADIADRGRFDLPINAGSKLRPHRD